MISLEPWSPTLLRAKSDELNGFNSFQVLRLCPSKWRYEKTFARPWQFSRGLFITKAGGCLMGTECKD